MGKPLNQKGKTKILTDNSTLFRYVRALHDSVFPLIYQTAKTRNTIRKDFAPTIYQTSAK
jgi:hypothetical protein